MLLSVELHQEVESTLGVLHILFSLFHAFKINLQLLVVVVVLG